MSRGRKGVFENDLQRVTNLSIGIVLALVDLLIGSRSTVDPMHLVVITQNPKMIGSFDHER